MSLIPQNVDITHDCRQFGILLRSTYSLERFVDENRVPAFDLSYFLQHSGSSFSNGAHVKVLWSRQRGAFKVFWEDMDLGGQILEPVRECATFSTNSIAPNAENLLSTFPPISIQRTKRWPSVRSISEEPHIRAERIEFVLDMRREIRSSINNHPYIRWWQPSAGLEFRCIRN